MEKNIFSLLMREFKGMKKNPPSCVSLPEMPKNFKDFDVMLIGPTDSPYEGCFYYINVKIPPDYPQSPPNVVFKTPIYHMNI